MKANRRKQAVTLKTNKLLQYPLCIKMLSVPEQAAFLCMGANAGGNNFSIFVCMHTISNPSEQTYQRINIQAGIHRLCLHRFCGNAAGAPLFMVHGSVENGRIFYSDSGKGLAPWLASRGFDVYVADLRGRGMSSPAVSAASDWGLREMMEEDFPVMLQEIVRLRGQVPQHWLAHSWGGVMQLAFLARWSAPAPVASLTFFGTKRHIASWSLKKLMMIDLGWGLLGELLAQVKGYLPARRFGFGVEDESAATYRQTRSWVRSKQWLDPYDVFDYAAALKELSLPPAFYITGAHDQVLGHPLDVYRLIQETGYDQVNEFLVAGKSSGFAHNYNHVNLLTHKDAPADVFPAVEEWLRKFSLQKL